MKPRGTGVVRIGTSGWSYANWHGAFFPPGLPHRRDLEYLAQRFPTVEVNGTFYSLTRPTACNAWRAAVPAEFVFAIKASRYITHMLRLLNVRQALANFFASGILRLGNQLGPVLWQLPPSLAFDEARAEAFLSMLPRTIADAERWARRHDARTSGRAALVAPDGQDATLRHALEVRHASWLTDPALALLRAHGIALVASDTAGKHPMTIIRTANWAYVRLHGSTVLYSSRYTDAEIRTWADRVHAWRSEGADVYVYFDNDIKVHAPFDALRLMRAVERRGRATSAPGAPRSRAGSAADRR